MELNVAKQNIDIARNLLWNQIWIIPQSYFPHTRWSLKQFTKSIIDMQCYIFLKVFLTNFLTKSDKLKKNCGHYVCLASTYIAVTMVAWHLHNSSGKCLHLARTNISVNSQQLMRRLAFEVISQSETKSWILVTAEHQENI